MWWVRCRVFIESWKDPESIRIQKTTLDTDKGHCKEIDNKKNYRTRNFLTQSQQNGKRESCQKKKKKKSKTDSTILDSNRALKFIHAINNKSRKKKKSLERLESIITITIMSSEKVLSSASASASASAPLASPHVDVCKGINGLDKVVLRDPRGSSAEVPNLMIACFVFSISVAGFVILSWKFGFVFVKYRAWCCCEP